MQLEANVLLNLRGTVVARTESTDRPTRCLVEFELGDRTIRQWVDERLLKEVTRGM